MYVYVAGNCKLKQSKNCFLTQLKNKIVLIKYNLKCNKLCAKILSNKTENKRNCDVK